MMFKQVRARVSVLAFGVLASLAAAADVAPPDMAVKLDVHIHGTQLRHSAIVESGTEVTFQQVLDNGRLARVVYLVDRRGPIGQVKETVGMRRSHGR